MQSVSEPFAVAASLLFRPLRLGRLHAYVLEGDDESHRYWTVTQPRIWQGGKPVTLDTELATGTVVRVAIDPQGYMHAVELIEAKYDNPFA